MPQRKIERCDAPRRTNTVPFIGIRALLGRRKLRQSQKELNTMHGVHGQEADTWFEEYPEHLSRLRCEMYETKDEGEREEGLILPSTQQA